MAGGWAISLRSVQGLPAVPGLKKVTANASGFVALTPEGMAGTSQYCRRPKLPLPVCFRAPQLLWCAPISDGQLAIAAQSTLAFDEQRHQDIISIGKLDRVVMAMRHIWFDHKLANAEAAGLVQIHPWAY